MISFLVLMEFAQTLAMCTGNLEQLLEITLSQILLQYNEPLFLINHQYYTLIVAVHLIQHWMIYEKAGKKVAMSIPYGTEWVTVCVQRYN